MGREYSKEEATERRLASRELGRARRSIQAIRNFYVANAILWGVFFLLMLVAEADAVWLAATGGGLLIMVAGVVRIAKDPFPWAIGIAALWTVLVVARIVSGGRLANLTFMFMVAWTLGCWMMLPTTVRVKKLLAEHPDLWVSKKMRR